MNKDCEICRNLMMEGGVKEISGHIETCAECRSFYDTIKVLRAMSPVNHESPVHLTYEVLRKNVSGCGRKSRVVYMKWGMLAAALLLMAVYLPFSNIGFGGKKVDYALLSGSISAELESLDKEIYETEQDIWTADDMIDNEIDMLFNEIG